MLTPRIDQRNASLGIFEIRNLEAKLGGLRILKLKLIVLPLAYFLFFSSKPIQTARIWLAKNTEE